MHYCTRLRPVGLSDGNAKLLGYRPVRDDALAADTGTYRVDGLLLRQAFAPAARGGRGRPWFWESLF